MLQRKAKTTGCNVNNHSASEQQHDSQQNTHQSVVLERLGNRGVLSLLSFAPSRYQIGKADDPLEKEADRISAKMINEHTVQPLGNEITVNAHNENTLSRVEQSAHTAAPLQNDNENSRQQKNHALDSQLAEHNLKSGRPLTETERHYYQPRFQRNFSDVRIHNGADAGEAAQSIQARAFTIGSHIVFGHGEYQSQSPSASKLMAHELVHVVQQQGRTSNTIRRNPVDPTADPQITPRVTVVVNAPPIEPGADILSNYPAVVTVLSESDLARLRSKLRIQQIRRQINEAEGERLQSLQTELRSLRQAAAGNVSLALSALLTADSFYIDNGDIEQFVALASDALQNQIALGPLLVNETIKRFMQAHFNEQSMVDISVVDVDQAGVTSSILQFKVNGIDVPTRDGFMRLSDLNLAFDDHLSEIAMTVWQQVVALQEPVVLLFRARQVAERLSGIAEDVVASPEDYGLNDVREIRTTVGELINEIQAHASGGLPIEALAEAGVYELPSSLVNRLNAEEQRLQPILHHLNAGVRAVEAVMASNGCRTGEEISAAVYQRGAQAMEEGRNLVGSLHIGTSVRHTFANRVVNLLTGNALEDIDRACLLYREGSLSLSARQDITRHAAIRAGVALGLSLAAGFFGGWLGAVAGRGLGFATGSLGVTVFSSFGAGSFGAVGFLGGQDIYSLGVSEFSSDPYAQSFYRGQSHGGMDYLLAFGIGGVLGVGLGVGGHYLRPPPGGTGSAVGEAVLLYDASGNRIQVLAGEIIPPGTAGEVALHLPGQTVATRPNLPVEMYLPGHGPGPVSVQGGRILGPSTTPAPTTLFTPEEGIGSAVMGLEGRSLELVASGQVALRDVLGQPISVQASGGQLTGAQISSTSSLLAESRLISSGGGPLRTQVPYPGYVVNAYGQPVTTMGGGAGPHIVDLQAGTPGFLNDIVARTPGAQGIGVEPGNWMLAYQGIYPSHADDMAMSMMLARNAPVWPDTPAWMTDFAALPHALPWETDPARFLFPRQGAVSMLPNPHNPMLGQGFFPARGGRQVPHDPRMIPFGLEDIPRPQGGFQLTDMPQLPRPGWADQIYIRRPYGLGLADENTTTAMGRQINAMLNEGGFVEIRATRASELSVPTQQNMAALDQSALIAREIPGARVFRISGNQIRQFRENGSFAQGTHPVEQEMIREAARDVAGLGRGEFRRVIRIYKGRSQ